jgi:predicted MFS family arabinose efflux permease
LIDVHALMTGGGIGLSYVSFVVIVQQWFDRKRPIASGFSLTGFSVAVFSLPPLTQLLLDAYGWRGCLMLMSGVYLHGIAMAALLRPVPPQQRKRPQPRRRTRSLSECLVRQVSVEKVQSATAKVCAFCRQVFDFSTLRDVRFLLYGLGTLLMMIGHIAFIAHIVTKAERALGIEKHLAMLLPSIYGISNGVCRMLFSVFASLPKVNRTVQYGAWIVVGGVVCCLSCLARDFTSLAVCCSAFGMCVGRPAFILCIRHRLLCACLQAPTSASSIRCWSICWASSASFDRPGCSRSSSASRVWPPRPSQV